MSSENTIRSALSQPLAALDELHLERAVWSKIRWRMQLPLLAIVILSSLDRVNISFAALQMNRALGIAPEAFGFAVGIFFVGYLLFQFPSTAIQRRIGTRRWIAGSLVLWGCCATGMAWIQNLPSLYLLRFLLGAAESGLTPGIVYYCSTWMPRRFHAGAIAITLLAVPLSVIIGGPLSGWLMTASNPWSLPGWRWMFLVEGLPTILCGWFAYRLFADTPGAVTWLSATEKAWVRTAVADENVRLESDPGRGSLRSLLADRRVWAASGIWFALLLGSNGIIFWLPQVLKQISGAGDLAVGLMSAVPWAGIGTGMLLNAWSSDRCQERLWHLGIATAVGAVGLVSAAWAGASALALVCLFIGGLGVGGAQAVFWALPRSLLNQALLGSGITFINFVGNLASLTGPSVIGLLRRATGSFHAPILLIGAVLLGSVLLLQFARHTHSRGGSR